MEAFQVIKNLFSILQLFGVLVLMYDCKTIKIQKEDAMKGIFKKIAKAINKWSFIQKVYTASKPELESMQRTLSAAQQMVGERIQKLNSVAAEEAKRYEESSSIS